MEHKSFASMGRNQVAPDLGTIDPDPRNTQEFSLEEQTQMAPVSKSNMEMQSDRNFDSNVKLTQGFNAVSKVQRHHHKNIGSISSERVDSKIDNM